MSTVGNGIIQDDYNGIAGHEEAHGLKSVATTVAMAMGNVI
jgi:hypothetical protein